MATALDIHVDQGSIKADMGTKQDFVAAFEAALA